MHFIICSENRMLVELELCALCTKTGGFQANTYVLVAIDIFIDSIYSCVGLGSSVD